MLSVKSHLPGRAESGIYSLHRYIIACQWFYQHTGRFAWSLLTRRRRVNFSASDVEPGMRYVVAANHQTYLDPWVVPGAIPFSVWQKMGLPRAFVANRFFGYPFVGTLLRSVGSFPAREHPVDPYGLDYAISLIDRGQSIMIFPEGRLSVNRQFPAHNGVRVLAQQPNVRVVPVHLEWHGTGWRRRLDIHVGKPMDASNITAAEILERIYDLPVD